MKKISNMSDKELEDLFDKANGKEDDKEFMTKKEAMNHSNKLGAGAKKRKKLKNPKDKVGVVMSEFKRGTLHSGSGGIVKDRKQAIAIAMGEAGLSKKSQEEDIMLVFKSGSKKYLRREGTKGNYKYFYGEKINKIRYIIDKMKYNEEELNALEKILRNTNHQKYKDELVDIIDSFKKKKMDSKQIGRAKEFFGARREYHHLTGEIPVGQKIEKPYDMSGYKKAVKQEKRF